MVLSTCCLCAGQSRKAFGISAGTNRISNAAGLVLLFETGLVLFDLADIVDGGPNTPAGTVLHQNRGEWLLASV